MSNERNFFSEQIGSLHSLSSIFQYLQDNAGLMDADALLRSEYVLIVSAFDNYLHNIVRRKMRESFFASRPLPQGFSLSIEVCKLIRNEPTESAQQCILDAALRQQLEKDSFQAPGNVEYALGLIKINHVWRNASTIVGDTPEHIRNQLALIVKRRNQIAHESDMDPSTGMLRNITLQTVTDCRSFLEKLVESIDVQIT